MSRTKGTTNLSRTVKELIFKRALEDEKFPRRALAIELQTRIERMGESAPSEETLEKMISLARNQQPDREDNFWSVFDLEEYSTPPETLPIILKVWGKTMEDNKPLTIREALWIGRLYYVFKETGAFDDLSLTIKCIPAITSTVRGYATREKAYKLALRTSKRLSKPEEDIEWLRWIHACLLFISTEGLIKNMKKRRRK